MLEILSRLGTIRVEKKNKVFDETQTHYQLKTLILMLKSPAFPVLPFSTCLTLSSLFLGKEFILNQTTQCGHYNAMLNIGN